MLMVDLEKCTGCGACVQRCPKQCISWKKGEFDFWYPEIQKDRCIACGMCERVCPIEKALPELERQRVFAAVHRSADVLAGSTSGGAFSAIAEIILEQNGVVYGAAMDDEMRVRHIRVDNESGMRQLRGSKYLQSNTEENFRLAESDLKAGKKVLYSGTPCQIDGLKSYLSKEYENLYTADIVCHGVGSQSYFDKYMTFARKRYGDIRSLQFRAKTFSGWSCSGSVTVGNSGGEKTLPYRDHDNYYYAYFLSGEIYRSCCYTCKYANTQRVGDYSLGDYWGVEALKLSLHTENGCSLLFVNNAHAQGLLAKVTALDMVETTVEQATYRNHQLKAPTSMNPARPQRIKEYNTLSGEEIQRAYLRTHRKTVIKGMLKSMIPYQLRLLIRGKRK